MLKISDIQEQNPVIITRIEECKKEINFWIREGISTTKELLIAIYFRHFLNSDTKVVQSIEIGSLAVYPSLPSDSTSTDLLEEISSLIDDVLLILFKDTSETDRNDVSDKIFAIIEDFVYTHKICCYPLTQ